VSGPDQREQSELEQSDLTDLAGLASLTYDDRGLIPVVVQDVASGAVLMLAYADREAVQRTVETGEAHFWSRSRRQLWRKGETSGNVLKVEEILVDCDQDALLVRARPVGPTCHRGTRSCFEPNPATLELGWLWQVLEGRRGADPDSSYTARLLAEGLPRVAQKVGEEAVETVIAALTASGGTSSEVASGGTSGAASGGTDQSLVEEASDLLYHLLVLLLAKGVEPRQLGEELLRRHPMPSHGGSRTQEEDHAETD
jgi:phosphoribosyl-ATP pyrophosphohydrolase/phosphoribosyl-AMP cyclohydrolase